MPVIRDCEFVQNTAGSGAGIYADADAEPTITGCHIHDNVALGPGGGVAVEGNAAPYAAGCTISGNSSGDGGGVYVGAGSVVMVACSIVGNTSCFGGGLSLASAEGVIVRSSVISGNTGTVWGGALSVAYSTAGLDRCTIAGNESPGAGAIVLYDGSLSILNGILEGNDGSTVFSLEGVCQLAVTYCDVWNNQGDLVIGDGPAGFGEVNAVNANGDSCDAYFNLLSDPGFLGPMEGDYHLGLESPCIDAGDPSSSPDPDGTVADIGAYPAAAHLSLSAQIEGSTVALSWSPCPGASSYWLYGAANLWFFLPGTAPGFEHRLAVLPATSTQWLSAEGIGDPTLEWTYLVCAMDEAGWELARSNRAGEREFLLLQGP